MSLLLSMGMVMAGDPFRVDENLEMGTNDIYNVTNVNATNFYGNLTGGLTIGTDLNFNEYSISNATNISATTFNGALIGNADSATSWDSETSQADLNVNSSNWWASITGWSSTMFENVADELSVKMSWFNTAADARITIAEPDLNVNYSTTSGTATTWDGETSQANLNVNSSNYWDAIDTPSDINAADINNDGTYILSSDESDLNVNYSTTSGNAGTVTNGVYTTDFPLNQDTTGTAAIATSWDSETSQSDLNVNSSNYWDAINTPNDFTDITASGLITGNELSGVQNWTDNQNYPTACPANTFATTIGDTITCTAISDVYLLNDGDTGTGPYVFDPTSGVALTLTQDTAATGLLINQNGNGVALNIDSEAATQTALYIESENNGTSGTTALKYDIFDINRAGGGNLYLLRDLAAADTETPMVFIEQDNAGDDQTALKIQQDGTGSGLQVQGHGTAYSRAVGMFLSYPEATYKATIMGVNLGETTGYAADFRDTSGGTGTPDNHVLFVETPEAGARNAHFSRNYNSSITDSPLVEMKQDNSADDQPALKIQQDGTGANLQITQSQDVEVIDFDGCSDGGTSHTTVAGSIKVEMPNGTTGYINVYT